MTSHSDILSKNIANTDGMSIYVLKCETDKYYVGKTYNIDRRYNEHAVQNGSEWTKCHKPLEIIEQIDNCDDFDEDKYVLKYMSKYGIDNVRGGSFSTVILDYDTREYIIRMIRGSTDKCFKCGSTDHFANNCDNAPAETNMTPRCFICKRYGHNAPKCYANKDMNGRYITQKQKHCCYRCGRNGHMVLECKNVTDIFGAPCHYFTDDIGKVVDEVSDFSKKAVKGIGEVFKSIFG